MTAETFYKIRNKKTGLFSKGGGPGNVRWVKQAGKTWNSLGTLRSHISQHLPSEYKLISSDMSDWEVIEYVVTEAAPKPISELMSDKQLVQLLTHSG